MTHMSLFCNLYLHLLALISESNLDPSARLLSLHVTGFSNSSKTHCSFVLNKFKSKLQMNAAITLLIYIINKRRIIFTKYFFNWLPPEEACSLIYSSLALYARMLTTRGSAITLIKISESKVNKNLHFVPRH